MLFLGTLLLLVLLSLALFVVYSKAVWDYAREHGIKAAARLICPAPIAFNLRWRQRNIRSVDCFFFDERAINYSQFRHFLKANIRLLGVMDLPVISLMIVAGWFLAIADWAGCILYFLFAALGKGLVRLAKVGAAVLKTK